MSAGDNWRFNPDDMSEELKEFYEDVNIYFDRLDAEALEMSADDLAFIQSIRNYYETQDVLTPKQLYRMREICRELGIY